VVRAGSKQPKLSVDEYDKLRGGINAIGQNLSADLKINNDAALEKSLGNAEQQRATDLTSVTDSFSYDAVPVVSFAERGLANLQGLNTDLALKQASVASSQARVNDLVLNNVNNQLSDVRRSPIPYQGISDNELKGFLGTKVLADDFVGSAFDTAFGPRITNFGESDSFATRSLDFLDNVFSAHGALDASFKLANSVESISNFGLGINQLAGSSFDALSLTALREGRYLNNVRDPFIALGNTSKFEKLAAFGDFVDSGFIKGLGVAGNLLGPGVSLGKTINHVGLQGNGFDTEGKLLAGKTAVDIGFASVSGFFPVGTGIASIYAVSDFFVNGSEYKANNGQVYTEWRGVAERFNDNQNNAPVIPFRLEGF